jgi:hypothetical protein
MPFCSKCGKENPPDALFCNACGAGLAGGTATQLIDQQVPAATTQKTDMTAVAIVGIVCAIISLLFLPPVFGIIAIVLGGYTLSKCPENQKTLGWITVILGAVFMVIGFFIGMLSVFL